MEEEGFPRKRWKSAAVEAKGAEHNKGIEIITVGPISDQVMKELNGLEYKLDHIRREPEAAPRLMNMRLRYPDLYLPRLLSDRWTVRIIRSPR